MVEQDKTGPTCDGLDGIFGSNQDETMRIDATTAETPESCASNPSLEEVYFWKFYMQEQFTWLDSTK